MFDRRLSSKQRSQATDLVRKGGPNMLGTILREIPDTGDDTCKDNFSVDELRKTWFGDKYSRVDDTRSNYPGSGQRQLSEPQLRCPSKVAHIEGLTPPV